MPQKRVVYNNNTNRGRYNKVSHTFGNKQFINYFFSGRMLMSLSNFKRILIENNCEINIRILVTYLPTYIYL